MELLASTAIAEGAVDESQPIQLDSTGAGAVEGVPKSAVDPSGNDENGTVQPEGNEAAQIGPNGTRNQLENGSDSTADQGRDVMDTREDVGQGQGETEAIVAGVPRGNSNGDVADRIAASAPAPSNVEATTLEKVAPIPNGHSPDSAPQILKTVDSSSDPNSALTSLQPNTGSNAEADQSTLREKTVPSIMGSRETVDAGANPRNGDDPLLPTRAPAASTSDPSNLSGRPDDGLPQPASTTITIEKAATSAPPTPLTAPPHVASAADLPAHQSPNEPPAMSSVVPHPPSGLTVNIDLARAGSATPADASLPQSSIPNTQLNVVTHQPPNSTDPQQQLPASSGTLSAQPDTAATVATPTFYPGGKPVEKYEGGGTEKSRAMQPLIFDERYLFERQAAICSETGVSRPDKFPLRPAIYADQTVSQVLRRLQEQVVRAKDYRVRHTYPRRPPLYPGSDSATWSLEIIDEPWKEYQQLANDSKNAERQARRERQQKLRDLQERAGSSILDPANPLPIPPGPVAEGLRSRQGTTEPEGRDDSPTPGAFETPSKTDKSKDPMSKKKNTPSAITIIEQQLHTSHVNAAFRSVGTRKYGWLSGGGGATGGPVSVASSPLAHLNRKKRLRKAKDAESGSAEGTPSKGPGHKRTLSQTEEPSTPTGKRQKADAPITSTFDFPEVEDKILLYDYKTVLQREVNRGGPMRRLFERELERVMLKMAQQADEEYQKESAGRLTTSALSTSNLPPGPK